MKLLIVKGKIQLRKILVPSSLKKMVQEEKNGTGSKNINYNVFQNDFKDESGFNYEMKEGYVIIKSGDKKDKSALNKTWIIVSDKSKKQVWKSTDGTDNVQILELSR